MVVPEEYSGSHCNAVSKIKDELNSDHNGNFESFWPIWTNFKHNSSRYDVTDDVIIMTHISNESRFSVESQVGVSDKCGQV